MAVANSINKKTREAKGLGQAQNVTKWPYLYNIKSISHAVGGAESDSRMYQFLHQ